MTWLSEGKSFGLLDESGNGNPDQPLIVGIAIIDDFNAAEASVKGLFEEHLDSFLLEGLPNYEAFQRKGFHGTSDPVPIQFEMMKLISRLKGCRLLFAYTDRSLPTGLSEDEIVVSLYLRLMQTAVRYFRTTEAKLLFESNSASLDRLFPKIIGYVADQYAREKPDHDRVALDTEVIAKGDVLALAIVDYAMIAFARWLRTGMVRNKSNREYRDYLAIERNVAWIECVDSGKRSTRSEREFH